MMYHAPIDFIIRASIKPLCSLLDCIITIRHRLNVAHSRTTLAQLVQLTPTDVYYYNSCKPSLRHNSYLQAELRAQANGSLDVLHACRPKCTTCIFKFCLDFGQFATKIGRKCSEWTFFDFLSKIGQRSEIQRFLAHVLVYMTSCERMVPRRLLGAGPSFARRTAHL